jgi:hypothetical protein
MHSSTSMHSSTPAKSAGNATSTHTRKAAVALRSRHPAVVITPENTMLVRITALLKPSISKTLLRCLFPTIKALASGSAKSSTLAAAESAIAPKAARHLSIPIRHTQAVFGIMRPL